MPFSDTRKTKCLYFKLIAEKKWGQYWKQIEKSQKSNRIISTEAKELIEGLFEIDPEKRLSLE